MERQPHSPAVAEAPHFCPGDGRRPGSPPEGASSPHRCARAIRRGGDGSPYNLLRGPCAESPGRQQPRNRVGGVCPTLLRCQRPLEAPATLSARRPDARPQPAEGGARGGARSGAGPGRPGLGGEKGAGRPGPSLRRTCPQPRTTGGVAAGSWGTMGAHCHLPRDVASLRGKAA